MTTRMAKEIPIAHNNAALEAKRAKYFIFLSFLSFYFSFSPSLRHYFKNCSSAIATILDQIQEYFVWSRNSFLVRGRWICLLKTFSFNAKCIGLNASRSFPSCNFVVGLYFTFANFNYLCPLSSKSATIFFIRIRGNKNFFLKALRKIIKRFEISSGWLLFTIAQHGLWRPLQWLLHFGTFLASKQTNIENDDFA